MRLHVLCFGLFALVGPSPLAAHADTIFDFTLVSTKGYAGGDGSFALNVPPPSTGMVAYSFLGQSPFTPGYQIDSFLTNYTPPPGGRNVSGPNTFGNLQYIEFTNGVLSAFSGFQLFGGTASCQAELDLGSTSYRYSETCFLNGGFPQFYADAGIVTIAPEAAMAPEPEALVLLGTGMLAMTCLLWRRWCSGENGH